MTPPSVLVERSLLVALSDLLDSRVSAASECYLGLVDRYERHEIRLRARADHLEATPPELRGTLFAPIETVHVAAQFKRAAARLELPFEFDSDMAVTLVVMRRERIKRIATLDRRFDAMKFESVEPEHVD